MIKITIILNNIFWEIEMKKLLYSIILHNN